MNIGNGNDNKGFVIESHEVTMRKENEIMKLQSAPSISSNYYDDFDLENYTISDHDTIKL